MFLYLFMNFIFTMKFMVGEPFLMDLENQIERVVSHLRFCMNDHGIISGAGWLVLRRLYLTSTPPSPPSPHPVDIAF